MAIFGLFKNRADKWQDWTTNVATGSKNAKSGFNISKEQDSNSSVFMKDLEKISKQYINQYDSDGDGKISYEEFEKYEVNQLKSKNKNIDENTLQNALKDLKILYANLNQDNKGDSKAKLDKGEVMNMFYTMSGSNGYADNGKEMQVGGYISQYEYKHFTEALSYGILTPEKTKQIYEKIENTVKSLDIPEEYKTAIKDKAVEPLLNNYNIQNHLKSNYDTKFKSFK